MTGCNTGRNIQKYKGGGASTLQDALENGNTASLNINLSSPAVFVGDGGGLSNINASATSGNLQAVTDNAATTTNKITLTNGLTSLVTSGNVLVTGNVTASFFRGDGGTLSNVAANKNFQEVTDFGSTSSNKITLTNGVTSLQASGNVSVTGNVTASKFYGDGRTLTGVALSTDLASNSTRIGTVSTDLTSNASRIGVVETDLASNSTRIGTVSTDLASNASRIGVVETDLASNSTRIGTVSTDLASNASRISTVSTDLASNSADLTSNASRIGVLETDLESNSTRIGTVSTDLSSNSTRIGTVSTDLASNSTRIGTVSTDLTSNASRIGVVETDLASNSTRIGTVSTDLASNSTRIGTVSTDLASNSSRIGTVSTDLTSNTSRISTLEGETQPVNRGGTGQTSYTVGQLLVASDTAVLSKLTPGESGFFLKSEGEGSPLVWANVATIGSATPASLSADGTFLTGGPFNGSSPATFTVQATTTNTASKLVARDGSGDIRVQEVIVGTTGGTTGSLTSTAWSGSAATLTTARDIGGVSFDGSGSISLPGVDTTGNQNTTGSAATLTTARDIGGVSFDGSASISLPGVDTTGNQNTTGSAATLTTARNIGGVSFDGSASISLPGVDTTGNQNTTGSAAKIASVDSTSSDQLPVPFMSAATGDVTLNSDSGVLQYQASTGTLSSTIFSGSGEALTSLPVSNLSASVPVTKGGTGLATVTAGDILYASADNTISARAKGSDGQFLTLSSGFPVWDSVSSTTITTANVDEEDTDHGLIFVSDSGTGAQTLKKEYGTLKYKPSSGTLTTSNIVTSDTSIHARNGIANTTPTHTLSVGTVVSIRESDSGDVFIVRKGDGYFSENVYIAKKLTIPVGGEIVADTIKCRSFSQKGTTVVAERIVDEVTVGSS